MPPYPPMGCCWAGGLSFFLRMTRNMTPAAMRPMTARPPTTPPTMAPTGVLDLLLVAVVDGLVVAAAGLDTVDRPVFSGLVRDEGAVVAPVAAAFVTMIELVT